jgi:hypothetical protein
MNDLASRLSSLPSRKDNASSFSVLSLATKSRSNIRITRNLKKNININNQEINIDELLKSYESLDNKIKFIDLISTTLDVITMYIFYIEHFDYISNNYTLSTTSNLIRVIFLFISLLVCFLIILRYIYRRKSEKIESQFYEPQNSENSKLSEKNKKRNLIIEIFIHLLQPYPVIHYEFNIMVLGEEVTYSMNLFLYFLCIIRIYMVLKVIRYWNLYAKKRSKKILEFFSKEANSDIFLYKANLSNRGFSTLLILGFFTLLICSLLLKVTEFTQNNQKNPFFYFWNSLWYLVVTMCTIGYGDIIPHTVLGRFIGLIVCLVGVFILSLLVVTLTLFTDLDSEELKAYNDIDSINTSYIMKNETEKYIDSILKFKIKSKLKKIDFSCVKEKYFRNTRKTDINIDLKKNQMNKFSYTDFMKNVREMTETQLCEVLAGFNGMWQVEKKMDEYVSINEELSMITRKNKNMMIACLNLAKCLNCVGSICNLDDISRIQYKKVISDSLLMKAKKLYKENREMDYQDYQDYQDSGIQEVENDSNKQDTSSNHDNSEIIEDEENENQDVIANNSLSEELNKHGSNSETDTDGNLDVEEDKSDNANINNYQNIVREDISQIQVQEQREGNSFQVSEGESLENDTENTEDIEQSENENGFNSNSNIYSGNRD